MTIQNWIYGWRRHKSIDTALNFATNSPAPLPHRNRGNQCRRVVAWPVVCCVAARRPPPGLESGDGTEQWRSVAALAGLQAALLHPALIHQCLLCFVRILMSVFTQNKTFSKCGYVNVHSTCTNTIHCMWSLWFSIKKRRKDSLIISAFPISRPVCWWPELPKFCFKIR